MDLTKLGFKKVEPERTPVHEWKEGDVLYGLLVDKREVKTKMGQSTIYTIELHPDCKKALGVNEDKLSFWGSAIIDERLKNCIAGEDEVGIEYLGKAKSQKGFTYKNFNVYHKKAIPERQIDEDLIEATKEIFEK